MRLRKIIQQERICNCKFVICLPTEHIGVLKNSLKLVPAFHIELKFRSVGSWAEGKTGVPGDKPLGARERTNNINSFLCSRKENIKKLSCNFLGLHYKNIALYREHLFTAFLMSAVHLRFYRLALSYKHENYVARLWPQWPLFRKISFG